jgi:hypothetical protein
MKPRLMRLWDRLMLRKRFLIETVNDQLKNISQIEHSRHRSLTGFMVNLVAGFIAYTFQPKKPSLGLWCGESGLPVVISLIQNSGFLSAVGNRVIFGRYAGTEVTIEGEEPTGSC